MNNNIERIIEETILEMLKERDSSLINLMMEYEKNLGEDENDREKFINETIEALSDKLGILSEEDESDEAAPMLSEQRKMLSLAQYLETGDESVLREEIAKPYTITRDEWKKIPKDYKMTKRETKDSRFPAIRGRDTVFAGSLPDRLKDEAKKNGDTGTGLVPVVVVSKL